ncbi:MAG: AbrB/MazE/SpoVT family DNA-binding domain-containing protein [Candidatus Limnocylindria bacterium]
MKSRLGERGQMVIPKPLRERLGLRGGQLMEIREERGQLIVTKSVDDDRIGSVYGILKEMREPGGFTRTDDFIHDVRGGDADAIDPEPNDA